MVSKGEEGGIEKGIIDKARSSNVWLTCEEVCPGKIGKAIKDE